MHVKFNYFMPDNSFEMKYGHLESIHVYLVNSCLINSFKRKCEHLPLIHVYLVNLCLINCFKTKYEGFE